MRVLKLNEPEALPWGPTTESAGGALSDYWNSERPRGRSTSVDDTERASFESSIAESREVTYPPLVLLILTGSIVAVVALLFLGDTDPVHWAGYVLGAFGTSLAVVAYRHVDLRRRRSPMYVGRNWHQLLASSLLLSGIALGMVHVYIALQTVSIR
jgi:hypothetical protein